VHNTSSRKRLIAAPPRRSRAGSAPRGRPCAPRCRASG
jgi:hypothetical protein